MLGTPLQRRLLVTSSEKWRLLLPSFLSLKTGFPPCLGQGQAWSFTSYVALIAVSGLGHTRVCIQVLGSTGMGLAP